MSEEALELRVLDMVASGTDTVPGVAAALGATREAVEAGVRWGVQKGLLTLDAADPEKLAATTQGRFVVGMRDTATHSVSDQGTDLASVASTLGGVFAAAHDGERREVEAEHGGDLVADPDREAAVRRIADAYAQGTITPEMLSARTDAALRAATRAELGLAVTGLPEAGAPVVPLRRADGLLSPEGLVSLERRVQRLRVMAAIAVLAVLVIGVLIRVLG